MASKARREYYQAKGVCPNCGCREVEHPYKACTVCREHMFRWMQANREHQNAKNKERYDRLRSQGLCVYCKNPSDGLTLCRTCMTNKSRTRIYRRPLQSRNRWKVGKA